MPPSITKDSIVILGAGIIGLDVALALAERGYGPSVTVLAEFLPGDASIRYTSPAAGCNFSALSGNDPNALRWDRLGYAHLVKLADSVPKEAFVSRTESFEYWDKSFPHGKIQNMSEYLENFRVLCEDELPEGAKFGVTFTTLTVNAPQHLCYLYQRLKDEYGVSFVRQRLLNIQSAFLSPVTKVVFNCTGNAARTIRGVEDSACYPTRGQVVLIKAPNVSKNMMRHGTDYETYIIPRPGSNGNVILGGYMQKRNADDATYHDETLDILRRTTKLHPELGGKAVEILAVGSGLRPSRVGGTRIEKEELDVAGEKRIIVHNYGAGGTGFQAGYGMALDAVESVEEVLVGVSRMEERPRL